MKPTARITGKKAAKFLCVICLAAGVVAFGAAASKEKKKRRRKICQNQKS